jgi:hypothetical protein
MLYGKMLQISDYFWLYRYGNPTQPYEWKLHGFSACVGPVKGAGIVKAKAHNMLINQRNPETLTLM